MFATATTCKISAVPTARAQRRARRSVAVRAEGAEETAAPVAVRCANALADRRGRIDARDGGGTLAYVGELSNHNLGTMANFAFGALRSLKYDDLTIVLNGNLDGEMVTEIRFGGIGAKRNFLVDQVAKIPLIFNIRVEGPFRGLIFSAKSFYDPSVLVEQNLSQLLQAQRDAEAAVAAKAAPVQPPASEPVQ